MSCCAKSSDSFYYFLTTFQFFAYPKFSFNLLSTSAIVHTLLSFVTFFPIYCMYQDLMRNRIGLVCEQKIPLNMRMSGWLLSRQSLVMCALQKSVPRGY